ncbi:MAG: tyrosine-type recombinase/integrase [Campylobacterales bacterium]
MASIFAQRGKLYANLSKSGRRERVSLGLDDTPGNRRKAEKLLPEMITGLLSGSFVKGRSVQYYADLYFKQKQRDGMRAATIYQNQRIAKKFLDSYGSRPIHGITAQEVRDWFRKRLDDKSAATFRNYHSVVHGIFEEALLDEEIQANPVAKVRKPKMRGTQKPPDPFSPQEVRQLIEGTEGWLRNLIALMFLSGIRTGEALGLRWENVDFNEREIRIYEARRKGYSGDTKTEGSRRILPLLDALLPYMQAQRRLTGAHPSGFVFVAERSDAPWKDSSRITAYHWYPLLERLGMRRRIMYQLRHSFAIAAIDTGSLPVSRIAQMMGHTSTQMIFQRYGKFIRSEKISVDLGFNLLSA